MKAHIQHLHESSVEWSPPDAAGVRHKVLNTDPASGALIALVELPAGWAEAGPPHAHSHTVEIYILSGDLTFGHGVTYHAGDYHYLPAGVPHGAGSAGGAVCVVQLGGPYDRLDPGDGESAAGPARHVRSSEFTWTAHGEGANRSSMAVVRRDEETGAQMYVLDLPPGWRGKAGPHFHTVCEEAFIVAGDVALEDSPVYRPGSYLFRPPRIVHGRRERSAEGCKALVWTDGPLDFNYVGVEYAIEA